VDLAMPNSDPGCGDPSHPGLRPAGAEVDDWKTPAASRGPIYSRRPFNDRRSAAKGERNNAHIVMAERCDHAD
jgi:hypothetical protein